MYLMGWMVRSWNPSRSVKFSLLQDRPYRPWGPPRLLFNGNQRPSPGLGRRGPEFDHLSPSIAEVKIEWIYTSTPPIRLHDVDREKLTFFAGLKHIES
jgi:hypothetical protein